MTRAPLLLAVLISTLCGAYTHTAPAATVRMASETFVTNKITQAIAALPPATSDLTPATNYTDSATNALTDALTRWDNPMIVNQARWAENAISADNASYAEQSGQANFAAGAAYADWSSGLAGETQPIRRGDEILAKLDAAATAAQVTNIVRDLSLGGIWDSALQVWWTPRMVNGSLTYHATTNVNLNAEN